MNHAEFRIGERFRTGAGWWLCTDVGTRTIIAIRDDTKHKRDLSGPPYMFAEHIFDEYDIGGCEK